MLGDDKLRGDLDGDIGHQQGNWAKGDTTEEEVEEVEVKGEEDKSSKQEEEEEEVCGKGYHYGLISRLYFFY